MLNIGCRLVTLVLALAVATPALGGPTPAQKCETSKVKASGKGASGLLKCWAKAQGKGTGVDGACLDKEETKLFGAFAKAEEKGGCTSSGDAVAVDAVVNAFVSDATSALGAPGGNACAAAKEQATGKKAAGKLGCHAKAVSKGIVVDPLCLEKAEGKFVSGFAKAEARDDCTTSGDADAVEALVDTMVAAVLGILQPVSSTTTTLVSTTTTTTPPTSTTTTTVSVTTTTTTPPTSTTTTSTTSTTVAVVRFSTQVQPIFTASCAGCHGGGSPAAGLNLTAGASYAELVNVASGDCSGYKQVLPGAPGSSYLMFKLQGTGPCFKGKRMPNNTGLPAAQIQLISDWIFQGALNN